MNDAELLNWVLSYRPTIQISNDQNWFWIEWRQRDCNYKTEQYTNGRAALRAAVSMSSSLPKNRV